MLGLHHAGSKGQHYNPKSHRNRNVFYNAPDNAVVQAILLFGSETWSLTPMARKQLRFFMPGQHVGWQRTTNLTCVPRDRHMAIVISRNQGSFGGGWTAYHRVLYQSSAGHSGSLRPRQNNLHLYMGAERGGGAHHQPLQIVRLILIAENNIVA